MCETLPWSRQFVPFTHLPKVDLSEHSNVSLNKKVIGYCRLNGYLNFVSSNFDVSHCWAIVGVSNELRKC